MERNHSQNLSKRKKMAWKRGGGEEWEVGYTQVSKCKNDKIKRKKEKK
jgi:hypothetical protein